MTTRTIGVLAAAAAGIAVLALLARPLLPHHAGQAAATAAATVAVPAGVERLATQTARSDLRCPNPARPRKPQKAGCGTLQAIRRQTTCTTPARCQVDLVGYLHTSGLTVPVALTITLTHEAGTWRVVEVSS